MSNYSTATIYTNIGKKLVEEIFEGEIVRKYKIIYQDLKNKIEAKKYMIGSSLPSENTLQSMYQVSRDTVRKALQMLKDEGLIKSQKGIESIVINRQEYLLPISGVESYVELAKQFHLQTRTVVLVNNFATLPAKSFKGVDSDAQAKQMRVLKRVQYFEQEPDIIDIDYLDPKIVPPISNLAASHSLNSYFKELMGLNINYVAKEITVETTTKEDCRYLDLPELDKVAVIRSCTSLTNTRKFRYTESRYRTSRFRFCVPRLYN